jgi:hypothetical protein
VQLTAGGVPKLALSNPYFGASTCRPRRIALRLRIPFAGTAITPVAPLTFTSGKRYFAYFLGTCSGGTFDFIIHVTP